MGQCCGKLEGADAPVGHADSPQAELKGGTFDGVQQTFVSSPKKASARTKQLAAQEHEALALEIGKQHDDRAAEYVPRVDKLAGTPKAPPSTPSKDIKGKEHTAAPTVQNVAEGLGVTKHEAPAPDTTANSEVLPGEAAQNDAKAQADGHEANKDQLLEQLEQERHEEVDASQALDMSDQVEECCTAYPEVTDVTATAAALEPKTENKQDSEDIASTKSQAPPTVNTLQDIASTETEAPPPALPEPLELPKQPVDSTVDKQAVLEEPTTPVKRVVSSSNFDSPFAPDVPFTPEKKLAAPPPSPGVQKDPLSLTEIKAKMAALASSPARKSMHRRSLTLPASRPLEASFSPKTPSKPVTKAASVQVALEPKQLAEVNTNTMNKSPAKTRLVKGEGGAASPVTLPPPSRPLSRMEALVLAEEQGVSKADSAQTKAGYSRSQTMVPPKSPAREGDNQGRGVLGRSQTMGAPLEPVALSAEEMEELFGFA